MASGFAFVDDPFGTALQPDADAAGRERYVHGLGDLQVRDPARRAKATVESVNHFTDTAIIANASKSLGEAMPGLGVHLLIIEETMVTRGR